MTSSRLVRLSLLPLFTVVFLLIQSSCTPSSSNSKDSFESATAMVESAKAQINVLTVEDLNQLQVDEEWYTLIDVREMNEHDVGYIPGSVLIPRGLIEFRILNESFWEDEGMYLPEKSDKIIVYCRSGNRSALVALSLQKLGFTNVHSLDGGFNQWKTDFADKVEVNIKSEVVPQGPVTTSKDDAGSC